MDDRGASPEGLMEGVVREVKALALAQPWALMSNLGV